MSVETSDNLLATAAKTRSRQPSLLLRGARRSTLPLLLICSALLWVAPFIWMLSAAFSENSFGAGMASLLPRFPLTLQNFRDAWDSADWLRLYANTIFFSFGTFLVQLVTITKIGRAH